MCFKKGVLHTHKQKAIFGWYVMVAKISFKINKLAMSEGGGQWVFSFV